MKHTTVIVFLCWSILGFSFDTLASPPSYITHPIHKAAESNDIQTVKKLLDADPSLLDRGVIVSHWKTGNRETDQTPLYCAAEKGDLQIVEFLISKGAKLNGYNYATGSPLHRAARNGHLAIVKVLVDNGAYVDAFNKWTASPLLMASGEGHLDIVKYLLEKGASPDSIDNSGRTPLQVALEMRQVDVAFCLYRVANRTTQQDRTRLLELATEKQRTDIVDALKNDLDKRGKN